MTRILVLVGGRGPGLAETLTGVRRRGDVVVAGVGQVLRSRMDHRALGGAEVVVADSEAELVDRLEREHSRSPFDGVLTVGDDTVMLTAHVAHRLGLRGNDPDDVVAFRDKAEQRRRLQSAGLTVPGWATLDRETTDLPEGLLFPVLVKPTRGSGGALVFVVESAPELAAVVAECRDRVDGAGAVDDDSGFVVEEVLRGVERHLVPGLAPYVSVETASVGGARTHLAVTDRFSLLPPVLETGMSLPSCLGEDILAEVLDVVDRALDAVGLQEGMSHTEVMLTEDGPVIIEVNGRMGGSIPYLYPLAGGGDLFAAAADCALGVLPGPEHLTRQAVCITLQHPLGVGVVALDGLDEIRALDGVVTMVPLSGPGHSTHTLQDTLAALVLATVPDVAAARELWRRCHELFSPSYVGGDTPAHYRRTPDGTVHPAP